VGEEILRKDASFTSTPTLKNPRWLTQTFWDAQDHVRAHISLMRVSIPLRRHANHIALATSICDHFNYFEEVRCDALMEENGVWVMFPF
jgi:hypothetical protein